MNCPLVDTSQLPQTPEVIAAIDVLRAAANERATVLDETILPAPTIVRRVANGWQLVRLGVNPRNCHHWRWLRNGEYEMLSKSEILAFTLLTTEQSSLFDGLDV